MNSVSRTYLQVFALAAISIQDTMWLMTPGCRRSLSEAETAGNFLISSESCSEGWNENGSFPVVNGNQTSFGPKGPDFRSCKCKIGLDWQKDHTTSTDITTKGAVQPGRWYDVNHRNVYAHSELCELKCSGTFFDWKTFKVLFKTEWKVVKQIFYGNIK